MKPGIQHVKIALNWAIKTIRRLAKRKTFKQWETKTGNYEVHLKIHGLL
jgi:hypothetical protein